MGRAPQSQRRRFGKGEVLLPPIPAPAQPLSGCLEALQKSWRQEGSLAALWQDWPTLAGDQLAGHCRPLGLRNGVLTVGTSHPQWRQALLYSKLQLLAAIRAAGHPVKDLRIQQHHPTARQPQGDPLEDWKRHPSRIDVHGIAPCPQCGTPAPLGEMAQWGHCSFCRRIELSQATTMIDREATNKKPQRSDQ